MRIAQANRTLRRMTLHATGLRVIVVGCDGSVASERALRYALARAGSRGRVIAVHANGARAAGEALLRQVEQLVPYGVSFEPVLSDGPAPDAIARVARERLAVELVVGAHAAGPGTQHVGNVPLTLLAHADRPVVVVPAPGAEA
jgi:nucleotide-binding universal stress UspA family protein